MTCDNSYRNIIDKRDTLRRKGGELMRNNMKERREELGLSQQDVTDRIPFMTRTNYSSIERGRTEPNIKQMIYIAKVLKVEPEINFFKDFCDETDQKQKECIS